MGSRTKVLIAGLAAVVAIAAAIVAVRARGGDEPELAQIEVARETVRIDKGGAGNPIPAADADPQLAVGDRITTDADGLGTVNWFDGSLTRLGGNADFRVEELGEEAGRKIVGHLEFGESWHRVQEATGSGSRFEVRTSNAVASVRGTRFLVRCIPTCRFGVAAGQLQIVDDDGDEVLLDEGEQVDVDDEGDLGEPEPLDPNDPWLQLNEELDEELPPLPGEDDADEDESRDGSTTTTSSTATTEPPTTSTPPTTAANDPGEGDDGSDEIRSTTSTGTIPTPTATTSTTSLPPPIPPTPTSETPPITSAPTTTEPDATTSSSTSSSSTTSSSTTSSSTTSSSTTSSSTTSSSTTSTPTTTPPPTSPPVTSPANGGSGGGTSSTTSSSTTSSSTTSTTEAPPETGSISGTVSEPPDGSTDVTFLAASLVEAPDGIALACPHASADPEPVCHGDNIEPDGSWTIAGVPAGTWDVFAVPPADRTDLDLSNEVVVELAPGEHVKGIDLAFAAELFTLTVEVRDHLEALVEGAEVFVYPDILEAASAESFDTSCGCPDGQLTDSSGVASFPLPAGEYVVEALLGVTEAFDTVSVLGDTSVRLDLCCPMESGAIDGFVDDSEGNPVLGASVSLSTSLVTSVPEPVTTGEDGYYLFDPLAFGTWTVSVTAPEGYSNPAPQTVEIDGVLTPFEFADFTLEPAPTTGTIAGTVTDGEFAVGGATVQACLLGTDFCAPDETSDDVGAFMFEGLGFGTYAVHADPPVDADLASSCSREVTLTEASAGATGIVLVLDGACFSSLGGPTDDGGTDSLADIVDAPVKPRPSGRQPGHFGSTPATPTPAPARRPQAFGSPPPAAQRPPARAPQAFGSAAPPESPPKPLPPPRQPRAFGSTDSPAEPLAAVERPPPEPEPALELVVTPP